jgi:hypothetical protein
MPGLGLGLATHRGSRGCPQCVTVSIPLIDLVIAMRYNQLQFKIVR